MDYKALSEKLRERGGRLVNKTVAMGFDGFVDTIAHVIRSKESNNTPHWMAEARELGHYILERSGKNFSLELDEVTTKVGGNMPIMASALGQFGISVNCVGAFGYPGVHTIFHAMPAACQLHSFSEPGITTAVEFKDGKMILGRMGGLNSAGWETIKERIGMPVLKEVFEYSDLIGILNWSELDKGTDIWEGFLTDIAPKDIESKRQIIFFDLSDCTKRSQPDILKALALLKTFGKKYKVVLGLNHNEGQMIDSVLNAGSQPWNSLEDLGKRLFDELDVDLLLLHSAQQALVCSREGTSCEKSFAVEHPLISTGAGDNFNAGFCLGLLLELHTHEALLLAHATANQYVQKGKSPDFKDLISFFEKFE